MSDLAPDEHAKPLSQILRELSQPGETGLTVGGVASAFGPRALGALLFLFAAPNLLPLPPGSSTVLGAPLVLLSPQLALGVKRLWLPAGVARRPVPRDTIGRTFARLADWLERVETFSRPRLTFLFGPVGDRVAGIVCTLLSLVLILPVPFGNLMPAAAVAVLSLSLILRDGVLALAGFALAVASGGVLALAGRVILGFARQILTMVTGA